MFTLFEQAEEFYEGNSKARELLQFVLEAVPTQTDTKHLPKQHRFEIDHLETLLFISEGFAMVEFDGKPIFFLEPGDVIGVHREITSQEAGVSRIVSQSEMSVEELRRSDFLSALENHPAAMSHWQSYMEVQMELFSRIIASILSTQSAAIPEIRHRQPGEPIIIQETTAREVYTLLHGQAEVFLQDAKVGDVLNGEIFGAMSATTESRRSASVIAKTFCVYSVFPQEEFLELIETHPKTIHKLVNSMSRIIISQNEKMLAEQG